jgi:hypothetical protein
VNVGPRFSGTTCLQSSANDSARAGNRGLELLLAGHVSRAGPVTFARSEEAPDPESGQARPVKESLQGERRGARSWAGLGPR